MEANSRRVRRRVESAFGLLGSSIAHRPWRYLGGTALCTALLLAQLPNVQIDTSFEGQLPPDNPVRVTFDAFKSRFDAVDRAFVAVRAPEGLFQPEFIQKLAALHRDLETGVPFTEEVTSLLNVRSTRGEDDRLVVEELFETWPADEAAWAELERRARANPLYQELFLSRDGQWTLVFVKPDPYAANAANRPEALGGFEDAPDAGSSVPPALSTAQYQQIHRGVRDVVERHRGDLEILVGGPLAFGASIADGMERDFGALLGAATAVIGFLLFLVFRRISAVLLALLVVELSLAGAIGLMAWMGVPLDLGTQIMPPFLLAVGIGYAVHILTIFSQLFRQGGDKAAAISGALAHSGLAVLMTGLTTMGGLMAFTFTSLVTLRNIGIVGPLGVLMAVVYSLVLLPALLAVLPVKATKPGGLPVLAERWLARVGDFSVARRHVIVPGLAVLILLAVGGASSIRFAHHPLHWVNAETEFRTADALLQDQFGGSFELALWIRSREEGGLKQPELLQRLDALERDLLELRTPEVKAGKVIALNGVVKEIHQALNQGDPAFYAIPEDPDLLSQELLLFENSGSDDLEEVVDSTFTEGNMSVRVTFADAYHMLPYTEQVLEAARRRLGDLAEVKATGWQALAVSTFTSLNSSLVRSYTIAMLLIGAGMVLLIGRSKEALAAAIPNFAPIILTLGFMGYAGIPMGLFTLLVANIVLGLAVDDTIHFVHNYLRERDLGQDPPSAVRRTLSTTGTALLFTSVALACGFSLFAFASLENLTAFGLLAALAIVLAFVADIVVSPGLMVLIEDWRDHRRSRAAEWAAAREAHRRPPLGAPQEAEGPAGGNLPAPGEPAALRPAASRADAFTALPDPP